LQAIKLFAVVILGILFSFSNHRKIEHSEKFLEEKNGIYDAWRNLYERDQKFRSHLANDSLDCQNLIEACMLVSKYGYPKKREMGKYADTPWLTWAHNAGRLHRFKNLHLTFPMIYQGYIGGEITDSRFMDYLIRIYFHAKFGRNPYRNHLKIENLDFILSKIGFAKEEGLILSEIALMCAEEEIFQPHLNIDSVLGNWIRTIEPFYYKRKEDELVKVKVFVSQGEYYYYENAQNDVLQKLELKHFDQNADILQLSFKNNYMDEFLEINNGNLYLFSKEKDTLLIY
jgi:hypothetical protein